MLRIAILVLCGCTAAFAVYVLSRIIRETRELRRPRFVAVRITGWDEQRRALAYTFTGYVDTNGKKLEMARRVSQVFKPTRISIGIRNPNKRILVMLESLRVGKIDQLIGPVPAAIFGSDYPLPSTMEPLDLMTIKPGMTLSVTLSSHVIVKRGTNV